MSQILHMPEPDQRKSSKAPRFITLILIILFALAGLGYWLYAGRIESAQSTLEVQLMAIEAGLSSSVGQVLVNPGQDVKSGQPLLRLESATYLKHEAQARTLVRGSHMPTAQETTERVAAAQAAEEYMVRRVALARHEEDSLRLQVEQHSMAHARAQLQLRDLDARGGQAPSGQRATAQKAEGEARIRLENSKASFESVSRSRAAIEGELLRARQDMERARAERHQNSRTATTLASAQNNLVPQGDPTVVQAPTDGRLSGALPRQGQQVRKGEVLLYVAPTNSSEVWASAIVSAKEASRIGKGQLCYLQLQKMPGVILRGEVEALLPPESSNAPGRPTLIPLRIRITDPLAQEYSAQLPGQEARFIAWTNTFPGMTKISPLLAWFSKF